jgi:phosphate starvation-inducible PhoH-like protein
MQGRNGMTKSRKRIHRTEEYKHPTQEDTSLSQYLTHPITFLFGQAGTGKSHTAIKIALNQFSLGKSLKTIICRPQVECGGEKIGFLPGGPTDKCIPWLLPFRDVLTTILGDEKSAEKVLQTFEVVPLGLIRGRNFTDCVAILDEAQNCNKDQLDAFLTRLGKNGQIVITGSHKQSDLPGKKQCLTRVADELAVEGIASIHILTKNYRGDWIDKIERAMSRV